MVAEEMQQQCNSWYYQQQQHQQPQYYADGSYVPDPSIGHWSYPQPPYLQYQQHHAAAAYHQQQMQLASQQQQPIGWNNQMAKNNSDNNGARVNEANHALKCSIGSAGSAASDIDSPGTPVSVTEDMRINANHSPYEWMKKSSHQITPGKTRTKDKYRVVYTEHQRLELEKEFHSNKYITTNRKAELSAAVALSERQIKIWFQNRRAKERKQTKKHNDMDLEQHDIKPILGIHGVAHAPPLPAPSPLTAMANLSINPTTMNSMKNNLQPGAHAPSAFMTHHLHQHPHPRLSAPITATTDHPPHALISPWMDSNHPM